MRNRYYRLFTEIEIPEEDIRKAVNCFHAILYKCSEAMYNKCMKDNPELWIHCPKQTKKDYQHKEDEDIKLSEDIKYKKEKNV